MKNTKDKDLDSIYLRMLLLQGKMFQINDDLKRAYERFNSVKNDVEDLSKFVKFLMEHQD